MTAGKLLHQIDRSWPLMLRTEHFLRRFGDDPRIYKKVFANRFIKISQYDAQQPKTHFFRGHKTVIGANCAMFVIILKTFRVTYLQNPCQSTQF